MGGLMRQDLVTGPAMRQRCRDVAHGAGGHEHGGLLAEQIGHALAQHIHGRIVTELLVADLGPRDRLAHLRRRAGLGVGEEIDANRHLFGVARGRGVGHLIEPSWARFVIPGWSAGPDLRCAIAHRGISRFRVRVFDAPRNDTGTQCDRIFDKNFCARSLRGLPKKSAFSASSTISPLSMKITRCATLLAKPISWVTTIMVMPSRARSTITSSTSLIISGSSAEVGSSNSIAIGSIASARAMATRCCCPPDNSAGYLRACSFSPTRSSSFAALARASACDRPSTFSCARQRFSTIFRCGKSSKCWNSMPTRARSVGRSVLGSLTLMPSRTICPLWNGSSALTHLIRVDFPEPDGPHTTTTSPLATLVVQSFSA